MRKLLLSSFFLVLFTVQVHSDSVSDINFASVKAGALILEASPGAKGYDNLLNSDKDKYGITECANKEKWVVIGLSEHVLIRSVVITSYEKYSSLVKDFQILSSMNHPVTEWHDYGTYRAKPMLGSQSFNLTTPGWGRYLKLKFLSEYGDEHYCTISQISVHGSAAMETLQQDIDLNDLEVQVMETVMTQLKDSAIMLSDLDANDFVDSDSVDAHELRDSALPTNSPLSTRTDSSNSDDLEADRPNDGLTARNESNVDVASNDGVLNDSVINSEGEAVILSTDSDQETSAPSAETITTSEASILQETPLQTCVGLNNSDEGSTSFNGVVATNGDIPSLSGPRTASSLGGSEIFNNSSIVDRVDNSTDVTPAVEAPAHTPSNSNEPSEDSPASNEDDPLPSVVENGSMRGRVAIVHCNSGNSSSIVDKEQNNMTCDELIGDNINSHKEGSLVVNERNPHDSSFDSGTPEAQSAPDRTSYERGKTERNDLGPSLVERISPSWVVASNENLETNNYCSSDELPSSDIGNEQIDKNKEKNESEMPDKYTKHQSEENLVPSSESFENLAGDSSVGIENYMLRENQDEGVPVFGDVEVPNSAADIGSVGNGADYTQCENPAVSTDAIDQTDVVPTSLNESSLGTPAATDLPVVPLETGIDFEENPESSTQDSNILIFNVSNLKDPIDITNQPPTETTQQLYTPTDATDSLGNESDAMFVSDNMHTADCGPDVEAEKDSHDSPNISTEHTRTNLSETGDQVAANDTNALHSSKDLEESDSQHIGITATSPRDISDSTDNNTESSAPTSYPPNVASAQSTKAKGINMSCLENLRFSEFRDKMMAKLQDSTEIGNNSSIAPPGPPGSQDSVFKPLILKIKKLEMKNIINEMYTNQIGDCYRGIFSEILSTWGPEGAMTTTAMNTISALNEAIEGIDSRTTTAAAVLDETIAFVEDQRRILKQQAHDFNAGLYGPVLENALIARNGTVFIKDHVLLSGLATANTSETALVSASSVAMFCRFLFQGSGAFANVEQSSKGGSIAVTILFMSCIVSTISLALSVVMCVCMIRLSAGDRGSIATRESSNGHSHESSAVSRRSFFASS